MPGSITTETATSQMTQTQVDLIVGAVWLVCVIVCFLKWKTWTAIFGIIAPILSNIPTGWNVFTSHHHRAVHLRGTASRRDKARQTRLVVGEMVLLGTYGQRSEASASQPEIGEGVRSIPGATDGF